MTITAPLGLLALAALPAVVALHLFRDRLPERRVAGLFLFPVTAVDSRSGRRRVPLVCSPSFWLECALALLLAAWLSGPSLDALRPRHLVLVLDDTASMGARGTSSRARQVLREFGDGLAAVDRVTVIRTGPVPTVAVGPRGDAGQLAAFREGWQPRQPGHAATSALDLGRQLAAGGGELWFVTDGEPAAPQHDLGVRACGAPAANAALTNVRREPRADGARLRVTVTARGDGEGAVARTLRVGDGDRELARAPVALPRDGAAVELEVRLPVDAGRLRVELLGAAGAAGADELAIDDVAFVAPITASEVAVCDQLSPAQRRALRLDEVFAALTGWRAEAAPALAQLLVRDAPGEVLDGQLEVVIAPTAGRRGGYASPFVVDRAHPALAGAALDGVTWAAGGGDLAGQVLVASGDKVLLAEQFPPTGRRLWFDLDAAAGNLTRAPDWPILWANTLELAGRDAPGWQGRRVRVGDEVAWRGPRDGVVTLRGPDGDELLRGPGALAAIADRPGFYTAYDAAGGPLGAIAADFVDAAESDLRQRCTFDRAPSATPSDGGGAASDPRPLRRWLALLLLLTALADWWYLSRGGRGA